MAQLVIPIGSFVIGLVLLLYAADSLVRGASSIAKKAGLSALFIGLTVVSFGTSLPELMVNIFASFRGSNDIAIGNILGSNISNIFLILGISAAIYPLTVKKGTVTKEIPLSLMAVVILFVLVNDVLIDGALIGSILGRGDGVILICFFVLFMYYTFGISRVSEGTESEEKEVKTYKFNVAASMVLGGIVGLTVGANLMVDGAVAIARFLSISEALIGLTIVAVGTSLPELATSAIAAYRRHSDIAIGNIVGSNIFNIFWILGLSSIIRPLVFSVQLNSDIIVTAVATVILFLFMFIGKKNILQRWQGVALISMYVIYIIYLILRG